MSCDKIRDLLPLQHSKFHCVPEVTWMPQKKKSQKNKERWAVTGQAEQVTTVVRERPPGKGTFEKRGKWICAGRAFQPERRASAKALGQMS